MALGELNDSRLETEDGGGWRGVRSEGGRCVLQAAKRGGKPGWGLKAQDLMSVLEQERQ